MIGDSFREFTAEFERLSMVPAIEAWMRGVFACNQYIDAQAPWALRKTDPDRMHAVLGTLIRAIRALAITIAPVIPASSERLLDQLGAKERDHAAVADVSWYDRKAGEGFKIAPPIPIFPRIVLEEAESGAA